METLDKLKGQWETISLSRAAYDETSLNAIIKSRVNKQLKTSMQYFWASFALQILVYAMLSHVIVKYFHHSAVLFSAIGGIVLYIPFTIVLMRKFKRMASVSLKGSSLHDYVSQQKNVLESFFTFKKRYELVLIPLSAAIGVFLTFALYVPGGVFQHLTGTAITYVLTLLSCYWAIHSENKKNFIQPLQQLDMILAEYRLA